MNDLKELIKQCPELGDAFAEFENRIGFLENSQSHTKPSEPQPTREVWQPKQWDRFEQLEGRVIHVENKITEMQATPKRKLYKYK